MGSFLSSVADGSAVLTFVGVAMVALFGSRLRERIISVHKAQALARIPGFLGEGVFARSRLRRACHRRVASLGDSTETWSVSREISWLSSLTTAEASRSQLTWDEPQLARPLAHELRAYARRLELSTWVRIGSSTLADEEIDRATRVAAVLENDSTFRPADQLARVEPFVDLRPFGIEILAGPRWATSDAARSTSQRAFFDDIRVSVRDTRHGAFGPFDDLDHRWPTNDGTLAGRLAQRATTRAHEIARDHPDSYNGVLPRLVSSRVEASTAGPVRRLHLFAERTTFLTWLATNGDPTLPDDLAAVLAAHPPAQAIGANHVPVTLAVTSADGYVVLPKRASDLAIYPGCLVSAANGNVEIEPRHGMPADLDAEGFIDFVGATLRECREELGSRIDLEREDLRVAALIRYSDDSERESPVLVLHATSGLDIASIVDGMRYAHPTEGAFENGDTVLGVPVAPAHVAEVVSWLVAERREGRLTVPGFTSTLIAIAAVAGSDAVRRALVAEPREPGRPGCVRVYRR